MAHVADRPPAGHRFWRRLAALLGLRRKQQDCPFCAPEGDE